MDENNRDDDQLLAEFRDNPTPRSGKPWAEEDFAAIMQACRSGATIEQIARRIGRAPTSLPLQVRRMLPLEERHLSAELALPRLRQLDEHGDYDWLSALAQREQTFWERQEESRADQRARGFGALSDEHILGIALALVSCTIAVPADLQRLCVDELIQRRLEARLEERTLAATLDALARLNPAGNHDFDWAERAWPRAV